MSEPLRIEVVAHLTHSLFYMAEALRGEPHHSPGMALEFSGRVGDWSAIEANLPAYQKFFDQGTQRYPGLGRKRTLADVLELVALQSKDAHELAERARPWLGDTKALEDFLVALEPRFLQSWWTPARAALEQRRQLLSRQLEEAQAGECLARVANFYASHWPTQVPFRAALVPYLGEPKSTRGHCQGELEVLEVNLSKPGDGEAGVVFHELCHSLWSFSDFEKKFEPVFVEQGAWGQVAWQQLNEGLATALGNAWFDRKIRGGLSSKPWYADPVIDAYAHALYPLVEEYLEKSQAFDEEFAGRAIVAFRKALPRALEDFEVVAATFTVCTRRREPHTGEFQRFVMSLGPVRTSGVVEEGAPEEGFVIYWGETGAPRLRQTSRGWRLDFGGTLSELFELLKRLKQQRYLQPF